MPARKACARKGQSYHNDDSAVCESVILGGMWRHLQSTGKGFLPKAATEYTGSANDLLCTLKSMFGQLPRFSNHDACSPAKKYDEFEKVARQDK